MEMNSAQTNPLVLMRVLLRSTYLPWQETPFDVWTRRTFMVAKRSISQSFPHT